MKSFTLTYCPDAKAAYLYIDKHLTKPWKTKVRKDGLIVDRSQGRLAGIEVLDPSISIEKLMKVAFQEMKKDPKV